MPVILQNSPVYRRGPPLAVRVNPNGCSLSPISFGERSWAIKPCSLARWYALQKANEKLLVSRNFSY